MSSDSDLTVYFLGASRAIRVPWLLEEMGVPYKLVSSGRAPNGLAPPEFKQQIPAPLRKCPTVKDGDVVVQESGAIVEYAIGQQSWGESWLEFTDMKLDTWSTNTTRVTNSCPRNRKPM